MDRRELGLKDDERREQVNKQAILCGMAALTATAASGQFGGGQPQDRVFELPMPPLNTEFFFGTGFIPGVEDYAGGEVIDATVRLSITVDELPPGDNRLNGAEFFRSEIVLPMDIDPLTPGIQAFTSVVDGAAEGWSGSGTFTLERTISEVIGSRFAVPFFFTATTFAGDNNTSTVNLREPLNGGLNGLIVDDGWFLTVSPIPAPGSVAVLGLGALAMGRRRR